MIGSAVGSAIGAGGVEIQNRLFPNNNNNNVIQMNNTQVDNINNNNHTEKYNNVVSNTTMNPDGIVNPIAIDNN